MLLEMGKTEVDKDKQRVIDDLKKSFEELRNTIDKLELDIYNTDEAIQHSAIYVSGHFLLNANKFFAALGEQINKDAVESEKKNEEVEKEKC